MSLSEEVVDGTLHADGTLALDHGPAIPPGRVRVIIQSGAVVSTRGLTDVMDEVRRGQLARGYFGRSLEEMRNDDAARREDEEDYDRRMEELTANNGTLKPPSGTP
jgi:hypothetical protein